MNKKLIQALEPRMMLDGAAVATAIDTIDDLASLNNTDLDKKLKENNFKTDQDTKLPFVTRESVNQSIRTKQFVFIDSAVDDIEVLIESFDDNTEVYIIQSDVDGFKEMQNILANEKNIDGIHVIGHGSIGQIAFGDVILNSETIDDYKQILRDIGASLSANGDILFYGCNLAANESGEILIKQIAEITDADVAASDDVTGKGGDWDLEKYTGIIETKNVSVVGYQYALDNGVTATQNAVEIHNSNMNFMAGGGNYQNNTGGQTDPGGTRYIVTLERGDVSTGSNLVFDYAVASSSHDPDNDGPVNVYMVYLNDYVNRRSTSDRGIITFDNEILGIFTIPENTIAMSGYDMPTGTYPLTSGSKKVQMRDLEYTGGAPGTLGSGDAFSVSGSNKVLTMASDNGLKGDFVRVVTRAEVANTRPAAQNDEGYINEDATLTVSDGANANDSTPDASGEHTGDVINTSSSGHRDTDADGDTLIVTEIRTGDSEGNGTAGTVGSALTGTYGQLTLSQNGSYTYIANQDAADALDPGDTITDSFNYTIDDQSGADNATDKAVIEITIAGVNDPITAVNDTDAVNEDATINRSTSDSQELDHDDTDPDGDDVSGSFTITAIRTGRESGSGTSGTIGQALTGTYGVLTVAANGSYSYAATTSGADGLTHGATAIDYFTYTVRDHSGGDTDTAELAITVTGVGPAASNDTGAVNENATLSQNSGAGVIANDTGGDTESLAVTAIESNGTGTSGTVGQALTGTYGVLTMNADGSYSYVANTAAAEQLDASDSVTDIFTYTVSDDDDTNDSEGTLTITITGVDDDPVGNNDTGAINEDKTLTVNQASGVLSNDTDADESASLTVSAISGGTVGQALNGTYGVLTLNSNGSYDYVANGRSEDGLAAGATENDTFTYTVSDGAGTTDTATLTITVTGVGPQAVADTGSVNEDATLTVNEASGVISNDDDNASYDVESLAITGITHSVTGNSGNAAQAVTGTYGVLTMAADGSYEYVANQAAADLLDPGDTDTDVFTYTVKDDADKNASTATLTITVTGINDDITAVNDTDAVNANNTISRSTSDTQELDHDDTDPDADDVSGSFTITAIRTGANEGAGTAKTIGQAFTTTYGTMTVNADGSYTYAADQSGSTSLGDGVTATDSFNYTVQDHNSGDTDIATLVITITGRDDPVPVAGNDAAYINEDATLTVTDGASANDSTPDATGEHTGDVLLNDTHSGGDALTVADISNGSVGSAATGTFGQLTIAANGSYTYVANQAAADALDPGETGTDEFTYTVEDENGDQATATITFTVAGLNDPITAVNDTDTVNEDATISRSTSDTQELDHDDTDPDGDDVSGSFAITAIRTGREDASGTSGTIGQALTGTYGILTVNADGSYSYAATTSGADGLANGATAIDYFTYTVRDHSSSPNDTDTAELAITVTGVGPVASNDTGSVNEDATLSVNAGSGVTSNDTGGDTENLAVTAIRTGTESGSGSSGTVGQSLTGTYGTLTINSDGSYTYVADQNAADALDPGETATDTFTYTVADDNGTSTDAGEIVITVTGTNDDIIAVNDTDAVNEDATITRSTSDTQELDHDDTDADGDDVSGSFTITAIRTGSESGSGTSGTIGQALTGTYGTLTVNADGSYTYVADQNASDSIATGQTVTDTFTYTVRDHNSGSTDTAELSFTVTGINDENPVAVDDTDSVNRDATITRTADSEFDINADDTDADGDSLTITGIRVGQAEGGGTSGTVGSALVGTYGTLTLNSDGSYTYAADQDAANSLKRGDSAIEYFNYTVSDGTNEDIGVIAITVNGISDPPVPVDDELAIDAGAQTTKEASQGVLKNDADPDGDTLSVDSIRTGRENRTGTSGTIGTSLSGTYGDLTMNSDGSYTYQANNAKTLNPGETATEYFTYTATDGESSVKAQIAITVTGKNDPPEVLYPVRDPNTITGAPIVIKHKQIFDDPDTGIYDIAEYKIIDPEDGTEISLPDGLRLKQNKIHGSIGTPGVYSITIRAIDGEGLYADHTFTITVNAKPGEIVDKEIDDESLPPIDPVIIKPKKDYLAAIKEIISETPEISDDSLTIDTVSIADTASLSQPLQFNGGLRLMDAVANEVSGDSEADLIVGVKLNDDNQKNVELYSGQLSNGDSLPEWIKVNPETGETTADMPEGVEAVEVQLVALDKDGNTRDINIVLDKAKIKGDQDFKRGAIDQARVVVDNDANVNLIRENNNESSNTANNNLNAQTDFEGTMKLSSLQMDAGQFTVDVIDDNQSNVKMYKAELKGGGALPDWITIDPETGKIAADPSKGRTGSAAPAFLTESLQVLELKIIAEDEDGKERVIEVEIDLNEITGTESDEENSAANNEISFIPLDEQLKLHAKAADSYGEKIISLVS